MCSKGCYKKQCWKHDPIARERRKASQLRYIRKWTKTERGKALRRAAEARYKARTYARAIALKEAHKRWWAIVM